MGYTIIDTMERIIRQRDDLKDLCGRILCTMRMPVNLNLVSEPGRSELARILQCYHDRFVAIVEPEEIS